MKILIQFLNSKVGKLNQSLGHLKTIQLLIANPNKKPNINLIQSAIFKIQCQLPRQYQKYIIPIYNEKSFSNINKYLEIAIDIIKKDIDYDVVLLLSRLNI